MKRNLWELFGFYFWSSDSKWLTKILLAGVASVWLFFPSCMLTWNSSFALAAIIVTQLTTPYIRIAPAAGDDQLTGQMFKYRQVIMPILSLFLWLLFLDNFFFSAHKHFLSVHSFFLSSIKLWGVLGNKTCTQVPVCTTLLHVPIVCVTCGMFLQA